MRIAAQPLALNPVSANDPAKIDKVARQLEGQFAQMLIKSMRATSFGDGLMDGQQGEFYRDLFDQQMAVELSEGQGLGLADMLVRQLAQGRVADDATTGGESAGTASAPPDLTPGRAQATPTASPSAAAGAPAPAREAFVREVWPHAVAAGRSLGVDPATIVSHAALETGWGRALPQQPDGRTSFNLFGIKAGSRWGGAVAPASTLEYQGARAERSVEQFRAYESLGAGVADYARLLGGSPRYAAALGTGSDVGAFAGALQRAGYATDPQYATKLQAIASEVRALLGDPGALKPAAARPINPASGSVAT